MRAEETAPKWLAAKLAVVLLGSIAIIGGCMGESGILDPDSPRDDGGDSSAETEDPPGEDLSDLLDRLEDLLSDSGGEGEDPPEDPIPDDPPPLPPDPAPLRSVVVAPDSIPPEPAVEQHGREKGGTHLGEREQLVVEIGFSNSFGETVTDDLGTHYYFEDTVVDEDKVYPEEYWGTYPLYFFGTEVGVAVTVTNDTPRQTAKLRVETEAYVLLTDGSNGAELAPLESFDIEVQRGESVTIDASFTAEYDAEAEGMDGGLDRFIVKVYHMNAGGGKNGDAGLIMVKEGVFCPPDVEGDS